jgi:hypothetical protein
MEELYFYNRPFLNYHPYQHIYHRPHDNNGGICILIVLIIIIICVLCYLFCFNNRSYNKNNFTAEKDFETFQNSPHKNNYSALKSEFTMGLDVSKHKSIKEKYNSGTLSVNDFE